MRENTTEHIKNGILAVIMGALPPNPRGLSLYRLKYV